MIYTHQFIHQVLSLLQMILNATNLFLKQLILQSFNMTLIPWQTGPVIVYLSTPVNSYIFPLMPAFLHPTLLIILQSKQVTPTGTSALFYLSI